MRLVWASFVLFVVLLSVPGVSAASQLSCRFTTQGEVCQSAQGEITVYHLFDVMNSHIEMPSQTKFAQNISFCCKVNDNSNVILQGGACAAGPIMGQDKMILMRLAQATDSHAQKTTYTGTPYTTDLCLGIANTGKGTGASCSYKTTCSGDELCFGSIKQDTNSHVGDCSSSAYATKICCDLGWDVTGPTVQLDPVSSPTSNTEPIITGTATDTSLPIFQVWVKINSTVTGDTIIAGNATLNTPGSLVTNFVFAPELTTVDHSYLVTIYAVDNGQNKGAAKTAPLVVDVTPPVVTLSTAASATADTTPVFSYTATDATTQIKTLKYQVKKATGGTVVIDWTTIQTPNTFETGTLTDETYVVTLRATDSVDLSATDEEIIIIDTKAPTTTDNVDGSVTYSPSGVTFDLSCNDDYGGVAGSGCATIKWCLAPGDAQTPCTVQEQGSIVDGKVLVAPPECVSGVCTWKIFYRSIDGVGNTEAIKQSAIIVLDAESPTCTLTALPAYTPTNTVSLIWTTETGSSGTPIESVVIRYKKTGDTSETEVPATISPTAIGNLATNTEYQFRCLATSGTGQTGSSTAVKTYIDTVPPRITVYPVPSFLNTTEVPIFWLANDTNTSVSPPIGSGVVSLTFQYRVNGGTWATWKVLEKTDPGFSTNPTTPQKFGKDNIPVSLTSGATYDIRVLATDAAGHNSPVPPPATVLIDFGKPVCSLDDLPPFAPLDGDATVSWTSIDTGGSGVAFATIKKSANPPNWQDIPPVENDPTGSEVIDLANGQTVFFQCRAFDFAGNKGDASEIVSLSADYAGPTIGVTTATSVKLLENLSVAATILDHFNEIESVSLTFNGSTVVTTSITASSDNQTWNVTWTVPSAGKGKGIYSFSITATDALGNENTTTKTFSIVTCVEGSTKSCGSNVGVCEAGIQLCVDNEWEDCQNQTLPTVEVCNNKDDDCDGSADENLTKSCGGPNIGVCKVGMQTCLGGVWTNCIGAVYPETSEFCGDDLDNDCDGSTDELCACSQGDTQACGSDVGVCSKGTQTCTSSGVWGDCEDSVDPIQEICGNGKDDDCDDSVDNGCDVVGTCSNGFQDANEAGVDCGGVCPTSCETSLIDSPYFIFTLIGVVMLVALLGVVLFLRSRGKELTWDEVLSRWS
ncbi:MAG: fibronectin type III domain-containing protein [Nanoarchaeota archaeon]|nr:fibronectin type III domain-containing protein [Nanoarchaeota archaeon]